MHCRACLYSITWLYERVVNQIWNLAGLIINPLLVPGLWTFQRSWGALGVNLRRLMVAGGKQAELVSFDPKSRKTLWFWQSRVLWFLLTWGSKQMSVCEREGKKKEHKFKWECFCVMFLTALSWKTLMQGSSGLFLYGGVNNAMEIPILLPYGSRAQIPKPSDPNDGSFLLPCPGVPQCCISAKQQQRIPWAQRGWVRSPKFTLQSLQHPCTMRKKLFLCHLLLPSLTVSQLC